MSVQEIQKMYDNLYSSRYNDLVKTKNNSLADLDKQEAENKENFYNQRNQTAVSNASSKRSIRDYMAKNNLLQSGESVDALLRNNTDYANSMGAINSNEAKFKNDIINSRNKINSEFEGNNNALKGEIEAQKIKDILAYQEKQAELAAQAAARSYSAGSGGSSKGISENTLLTNIDNEVNYALKNMKFADMQNARNVVENAYSQGYLSDAQKNNYVNRLNSTINAMKKSQAQLNKGTLNTGNGGRFNKNQMTQTRL